MQKLAVNSKSELRFDEAQERARTEAAEHLQEPMLLSWLNRRTGQHFPRVECCQEDGKESWEIYAESRGGSVRVEIGDDFVFIFREGSITD